jgi:hypothetical protein
MADIRHEICGLRERNSDKVRQADTEAQAGVTMAGGRGRASSRTILGFAICAAVVAIVVMVHGLLIERFLWLALGVAMGLACHELGHTLCAAIVSFPIRLIAVGVGPLLWRRRSAETWLELRLVPFSGFVATYPLVNSRWYRRILFVLGGVLGNVAVICVVAWLDARGVVPKPTDNVLGPIVLVQVYLIVANLVPFRATVGGTVASSDGLQLLRLFWGSQDEVAQLRAAYAMKLSRYSNGNLQLTMNSDSLRTFFNVSNFQSATDENGRRDYREALVRDLERGNLLREEKMYVLDSLVTDGLISGDPDIRNFLDEWSRHALALGPECSPLLGSRGAVLVELGRYEAGKALLEPLVAAHHDESFDSRFDFLLSQAFLARAESALGNPEAARCLAEAARSTSNALPAWPRMMAMLSRLEAET